MSYYDYSPYDLYFATEKRWSGPSQVVGGEKMVKEHAHLVHELITQSGNMGWFRARLESDEGCFTEPEVMELLSGVFEYIETLRSPSPYIWAAGVLTFFLLVGNKAPRFRDQGEFYLHSGLGSPPPILTSSEQIRAPPCRWWGLTWEAKQFIRDLTCFDPKERPTPEVAANHPWFFSNLDLEFNFEDELGKESPEQVSIEHTRKDVDLQKSPANLNPGVGDSTNSPANSDQITKQQSCLTGQQGQIGRFRKLQGSGTIASDIVVVQQHTRRRPNSSQMGRGSVPGKQITPKKRTSMDIDSFRSIIKIQKEEASQIREHRKQTGDPVQKERTEAWNTFMKNSAKASRKSKAKHRSAKRKQKKEEKELMDRNTEEFWTLYYKTRSDEEWMLTEDDWERYHYLKYEAKINEDEVPSWIRQGYQPTR